ncbi:HAD-IIIC family phosphatase [Streptomyces sp. NPDC059740]|uniref:HAD-IIIC family phosphatase n=1 Tax=Streptomyces sp. NPDC059740 TaxID=3346926 RepID=UPI0036658679
MRAVAQEHTAAEAPSGTREAPDRTLTRLHHEGLLARRYPEVRGLLREVPEERLTGLGHLLARLDVDEVLAHHPEQPVLRLAVTGHGTPAGLVEAVTAETARHGLLTRHHVADFGTYVQELTDPGSELHRSRPDIAVCLLDPRTVLDELPVPWTPEDLERVLDAKAALLDRLAAAFAGAGSGTLVLNTVPLTREVTHALVAARDRARAAAAWHEWTARLLRLGERHPRLHVVDLAPLLAEGLPAQDPRLSAYAKAHLSPALVAGHAREIAHLARRITGRTRKCLLLDLDGTLWGGVLGDDGLEGIELGEGYRGEAFAAFQRLVRQLGSQGVLLAVVSKNDEEPVRRVLRDHPAMVLGEQDFVAVHAGWHPKPESITALAGRLNLGTDAFVLVDDSTYECALARHELPEVETVQLGTDPALHVSALLREGWFDVAELTGEDRARTDAYRAEAARRDFLDSADGVADFLRGLGVEVRLSAMSPAEVARVSQMTLRTNQFNLTVERLQPAAVQEYAQGPGRSVLTVRSADRFGDNGVVGAVFCRREGAVLHLDNFLLSCRVFARGIEQACLSAVLRAARDTGAEEVRATYRSGPKNAKVASFYPRHGFTEWAGGPAGTVFRHDLVDVLATPEHIRLTEDYERTRT